MNALLIALSAYILGSIPFGYLLVQFFLKKDVRDSGSGNIGATNVARTSPLLGVATLVLDAVKGMSAVLLARHFHPGDASFFMAMAAFFAVAGHMFPIWLHFRGGKGVATGIGSILWIAPKSVLVAVAIFLVVLVLFRYVSLGSIVSAMSFPFLAWRLDRVSLLALFFIACISALVVGRHHHNIQRLVMGTESRLTLRRG